LPGPGNGHFNDGKRGSWVWIKLSHDGQYTGEPGGIANPGQHHQAQPQTYPRPSARGRTHPHRSLVNRDDVEGTCTLAPRGVRPRAVSCRRQGTCTAAGPSRNGLQSVHCNLKCSPRAGHRLKTLRSKLGMVGGPYTAGTCFTPGADSRLSFDCGPAARPAK
jgi:hypothetical protein